MGILHSDALNNCQITNGDLEVLIPWLLMAANVNVSVHSTNMTPSLYLYFSVKNNIYSKWHFSKCAMFLN